MERTVTLDTNEKVLLQQLDQERTQALAMIGALSLDMETARKNLEAAAERQRGFIRQALAARNIERYDNARAANGAIVVTLPDPPAEPVPMPMGRANGTVADITKE